MSLALILGLVLVLLCRVRQLVVVQVRVVGSRVLRADQVVLLWWVIRWLMLWLLLVLGLLVVMLLLLLLVMSRREDGRVEQSRLCDIAWRPRQSHSIQLLMISLKCWRAIVGQPRLFGW